ncbi:hypothetical protein EDF81_0287 [Enterobacter sp. BIGb0383]|nr:hypothetical protein EDF81_0287 [Enterobacter sp. BIGb0383]ROS11974.1 hypothetical protein EC848_0287 [Enterobacter sp. BIGb0359]
MSIHPQNILNLYIRSSNNDLRNIVIMRMPFFCGLQEN